MKSQIRQSVKSVASMLIVLLVVLAGVASGQETRVRISPAVDESGVQPTLSADEITSLLKREPGLLFQVKQALVEKALEQGRLLDQRDLNDAELFSLIETDINVRAVATHEIVTRGYVTIHPNSEEYAEDQRAGAGTTKRPTHVAGPAPAPTEPSLEQRRLRANAQALANRDSGDTQPALPSIAPSELPMLLRAAGTAPSAGSADVLQNAAAADRGLNPVPDTTPPPPTKPESLAERRAAQPQPNDGAGESPNAQPASDAPRPPQGDGQTADLRTPREPYANVPSLYDMYQQAPQNDAPLKRFGADLFQGGSGRFDDLPMDLPVDSDYVLGPGDGLTVDLTGSVSERLQRAVDREGRVTLPEVGPVPVAGRTLGEVQHEFRTVLRSQFRSVDADVSVSRLRTIRIYVVGDVQHPGAYDINSLSTPLNALYAAGGPTKRGSLRRLLHYRGTDLVQDVDGYDLILHGIRNGLQRLEAGDSVVVPPIGAEVTIEGMVRRPAIYELHGEKTLAEALALAGGVLPTGTLRHINVERLQAHEQRTMLSLDIPEKDGPDAVNKALAEFAIQDGDRIRIAPILPYSRQTIYLDGHVYRPGKYPYRPGMRVADLIHSYQDLLPEPSSRHAEIIRLEPPDYRPVVIAFNLGEALKQPKASPELQAFDTVRVFGRYDFEDPPAIIVTGEVRQPGEHRTNGETHLSDAIFLAGGVTRDAETEDVQVYRRTPGGKIRVFSANLAAAVAGDRNADLLIEPHDRIVVHRNLAKIDPPAVYVQGEVANPGKYPLGEGMTVRELVEAAGGLKRSAYDQSADLSRYLGKDGQHVRGGHEEVALAKALSGDEAADVVLREGDTLNVRQIAGWEDIGSSITVRGEVLHPGTYGIHEGERLSSILRRAGGFRDSAYPTGAVLQRVQVRELDEKSRQTLIHRIETMTPTKLDGPEAAGLAAAFAAQQRQILTRLRSEAPSGRMVIRISPDIARWQNTPLDIEVRAGDTLYIPKRPGFVLINGQVNNPSAITYIPGKNAGWYLRRAGGITSSAEKKNIFIVRADGSVAGGDGGGWWNSGALGTVLQPGDTVVVPERVLTVNTFWKTALNSAQLMSSLAISAAAVHSF